MASYFDEHSATESHRAQRSRELLAGLLPFQLTGDRAAMALSDGVLMFCRLSSWSRPDQIEQFAAMTMLQDDRVGAPPASADVVKNLPRVTVTQTSHVFWLETDEKQIWLLPSMHGGIWNGKGGYASVQTCISRWMCNRMVTKTLHMPSMQKSTSYRRSRVWGWTGSRCMLLISS